MAIPPDALGFAVVIATLLGSAFAVKLLVWGSGPIRRIRGSAPASAHLAALEAQVQELTDTMREQAGQLDDVQQRLDFAERLLTRGRDLPSEDSADGPPGGRT